MVGGAAETGVHKGGILVVEKHHAYRPSTGDRININAPMGKYKDVLIRDACFLSG